MVITRNTNRESRNVRVLQAFSAICIKRYCEFFEIQNPAISKLIQHLFGILSAHDLPDWERRGALLPISGRGDPWPSELQKEITAESFEGLKLLIEYGVEVGIVDIYGKSTNEPEKFAKKCADILNEFGIKIPNTRSIDSLFVDKEGWGEPVDDFKYHYITKKFKIFSESEN